MPSNIVTTFTDLAAAQPARTALALAGATGRVHELTFAELDRWSDAYAWGLQQAGLQPGERLLLLMRPSADFVALALGLLKAALVPVLIDAGMDRASLLTCIARAEPAAMVAAPAAFALHLFRPAAFTTVRKRWIAGRAWAPLAVERLRRGAPRAFVRPPVGEDTTAAIVFTTGSTGVPKGVVYTHGNYRAEIAVLREAFGIEPGELAFPANYGFALLCLCMGSPCVVPSFHPARPGAVDAAPALALLQRYRPRVALGSPAFWERIARDASASDPALSSLRLLLLFGSEVHESILRDLRAALPATAQIHTPYGSTEAQPLTTISDTDLLSPAWMAERPRLGICVGRPLATVSMELIEITDGPLEAGTRRRISGPGAVGEVAVRGPMVSETYFGQPEQTRLHKIASPEGTWHRMGDCGSFDEAGRLWLVGRKAHRIEMADATVFPLPSEAWMNRHPAVRRSALVGVGPRDARRAVLIVETAAAHPGTDEARALAEDLLGFAARHPQARLIRDVLFHPSLPVDYRHNTKIQRDALAGWAAARLAVTTL